MKFDRIAAGEFGAVNHLLGDLNRAVVIDADLGNNKDRLPVADQTASYFYQSLSHGLLLFTLLRAGEEAIRQNL